MPETVTRQGEIVQTLWNGSWIAAIATGVVVWGLIAWACIFHRKKRFSNQELPPQVRYNLPIEILYTVVPVIMVAVFFYFTARDQNELNKMSPNPDVKVKVEGFQWSWRFTTEYQGKTVTVTGAPASDYRQDPAPELVLPVSKKVRFDLESPDVIHSFWVPAFLFKRDVIPGVHNAFEIDTLDRQGVYAGRCAELCGVDHSRMLFRVKLVPQAEFDQYIATQAGSAQ
ncbi:putative cytochrome c oxidase subunit 2 [Microtetraspora sp. NBRC 13810]|uniref:aa3-type cytochrome oxidase subunit II n=1 Tax=Microtetraspora sp. NBRC 13810 TaxID=3030990 RepID=UPI0024A5470D|nr:cytochrome c oxidase subunit II [Microtetraspora sp. NBRC 13810]GLW10553.1 putative cytochrome c oxidase subunit 2 [Microtetraspora sp. NBRC 13810]